MFLFFLGWCLKFSIGYVVMYVAGYYGYQLLLQFAEGFVKITT